MSTLTSRQPRKRPAPSARDQEIFVAWQVSGKTQEQLAEQHKLTQCRISQIVRRVADWRSQADPREEEELTTRQQKRLDRWLEHERLHAIARQAIQSFYHEQRTVKNTKSGDRDGKKYTEESTRELPASVQWLKTALRAIEQLGKLEDKPYIPAEEPDERQRRAIMHAELRGLREEVEQAGKVTPSEDPWGVVKRWLDALTGEPNDFKRSDPAMRELAASILPSCDRPADLTLPPGHVAADPEGDAGAWEDEPSAVWEGEAPAEPIHPSPISSTYTSHADSPQPPAPERFSPQVAQEKSPRLPLSKSPSPNLEPGAPSGSLNPYARRLSHDRKLEQFYEASRRGFPIMIEFDPADGPVPSCSDHIDDYGSQPTPPPTKEEHAQMVQDYLAQLRAEQLANA